MTERGISALPGPDERSSRPRPGIPSITARFGDTWPEVERPLRAYLASLGAARHQIDDLVQETAARALERGVPYSDGADLRRWCFVVARRAWIDEVKRNRRAEPLDNNAAGRADAAGEDALLRVEDRHVVRQVERLLAQLRQADRDILVDRTVSADAAERNRRNVARHRARARLKVLIGPLAGGGILGCPGWLRRLGRPVAVAGLPAVAVIALVGTPYVGQADDDPPPSHPAAAGESGRAVRAAAPGSSARAAMPMPMPTQSPPSVPQPAAPDGDASTLGRHPRAEVTAPAGTHASLRRDDKSPGEPLICLSGDLATFCVDAPIDEGTSGAASATAAVPAARAAGM